MEFLIPGLLLVAVMVYLSTKIKRTAAAAFEAERVETDEFSIDKPEGFLNVLNLAPGLNLDIYSKDFGTEGAVNYRAARVELRIYANRTIKYATTAIKDTVTVRSEVAAVFDGRRYVVCEAETFENDHNFRELYKLTEKEGRVFELKLRLLGSAEDDLADRADQMFTSFRVK